MSSEPGVSLWLDQLKEGDHAAAQKLWEAYYHRLVGLARAKLQGTLRLAADEEDVALSAFDSFCRGAEKGRFPELADRDNLWRLLVTLTVRKAQHLLRDQQTQKRGGGAVLGESALLGAADSADGASGLEQIIGREPTPEFAAEVAEECQRLLDSLGDDELRAIAVRKMEADTNEEIAAGLGCAPSTVERRLRLIRRIWEDETPS
jgi:DNA-directed RNA polymerase specialized sigma24 family protein